MRKKLKIKRVVNRAKDLKADYEHLNDVLGDSEKLEKDVQ